METTMKQILFILGAIVALPMVPITARPQTPQDLGDAQILALPIPHDVDFTGPPQQTIWWVLHDMGISLGIVQEFQGCSNDSQVRLKVKKGTTLREAMDAVVASNSDYRWRLLDHVVNLEPKGGIPAILTTKLHSVRLHTFDNWTPSAGMFELFKMPEIRRRLDELKVKEGAQTGDGPMTISIYPNPSPPQPRRIDINLQDVSVQSVFNAIVRSHGNGTWMYSEIECNGEKTFTIHGWSY
jgi:hypothetical protein